MPVDDSYTVSLLHFEGADASTTFTDESGKVWTATGSAQIDTAQKKFQNSSGYFAVATSDGISTPSHTDFNVGSDNFTIELWMKLETISTGAMYAFTRRGSGSPSDSQYGLYFTSDNVPVCTGYTSASAVYNITGAASDGPTSDSWRHYAVVRNGDNIYLYVDGVSIGSAAAVGALVASTQQLAVGYYNLTALSFPGWIDEFRFSKGIARYTGTFTPIGPFGVSAGSESTYFNDGFSVY